MLKLLLKFLPLILHETFDYIIEKRKQRLENQKNKKDAKA